MSWLEQDLQRAHADPAVDWIVVVGHRPIYESIDNAKDWPPDTVEYVEAREWRRWWRGRGRWS